MTTSGSSQAATAGLSTTLVDHLSSTWLTASAWTVWKTASTAGVPQAGSAWAAVVAISNDEVASVRASAVRVRADVIEVLSGMSLPVRRIGQETTYIRQRERKGQAGHT